MSNIGSPFLRLPPELRNLIYGYVLDTSDLVHPATLIRIPKCAAAYYAARVRALVHKTERQPLGTPGRDATLSQLESEEAFIDCPATKLNAFNQLQYVNRQLRFETDQLEFKYNRDNIGIVRTDVGEGAPGLQLCKWMIMIRSAYLVQLGQLTITLSDTRPAPLFIPDAVRTIDDLSRLLKDTPNITVKYILPLWTLGLDNITYASVLEFVELGTEFVRCFLPHEADR